MLSGTELSEFGEALKIAVKLINWRFSVLQGMFFSIKRAFSTYLKARNDVIQTNPSLLDIH